MSQTPRKVEDLFGTRATLSVNGEGHCQKHIVKLKVDAAHVQPFR